MVRETYGVLTWHGKMKCSAVNKNAPECLNLLFSRGHRPFIPHSIVTCVAPALLQVMYAKVDSISFSMRKGRQSFEDNLTLSVQYLVKQHLNSLLYSNVSVVWKANPFQVLEACHKIYHASIILKAATDSLMMSLVCKLCAQTRQTLPQ